MLYRVLERVLRPDGSYDTLLRALLCIVVVSIYIRISVVSATVEFPLYGIGETKDMLVLALLDGLSYLSSTSYPSV
jgi:hypothetical protein